MLIYNNYQITPILSTNQHKFPLHYPFMCVTYTKINSLSLQKERHAKKRKSKYVANNLKQEDRRKA